MRVRGRGDRERGTYGLDNKISIKKIKLYKN